MNKPGNAAGNNLKTVEKIYEFTLKEFHNVFDYLDKIDQKLATIISVDAVIASILLPNEFFEKSGVLGVKNFLLLLGLILIIISMGVCIRGYLVRDFNFIDTEKTLGDYREREYSEAISEMAGKLAKAHKDNLKILNKKVRWMNAGFLFLIAGIILILVSKTRWR